MADAATPATPAVPLRGQTEMPEKERFFRYFQQEITDLQEQMGRLGETSIVGGERTDAIEHLVAGIARLGCEVNDASSHLPAYDQRTYGEAIKGLREKLDETRAGFSSKTRFTFKTARKNPSAVSLSDAAELAAQKRRNLPGYQTPSSDSSYITTPTYLQTPDRGSSPASLVAPPPTAVDDSSNDNSKDNTTPNQKPSSIRRPTFSTSSTVSITREANAHIILPSSASHASKPCSLTHLKGCVVDISVLPPQAQGSAPFAGLTIKNVKSSLLVCGVVAGPAHITAVEDSVIVVTCRQFRMHECRNVDVYLSCSSQPIIEDCEGIRFAKLPDTYRTPQAQDFTTEQQDLWSQITDFNNPTSNSTSSSKKQNWSLLPASETVLDDAWREVVPGGPGWSLEDILRAVRVMK